MNNKGSTTLGLLIATCLLIPTLVYLTNSVDIEIKAVNQRNIKPVTPTIINNPFVSMLNKPVKYFTPVRFKSSQKVIQKVNKSAHVRPFVGDKDNCLGYKNGCMRWAFDTRVFHVDVKYPVASYFSLPPGVKILSASFISDISSDGYQSNLPYKDHPGQTIVSGQGLNKREHIIIQPLGLQTKDAQILIFTTAGALNIMLHVKKNQKDEPMFCVEWVLPVEEPVTQMPKQIIVDQNYKIKGNFQGWQNCQWKPIVWNDGKQTFIQYNKTMKNKKQPVLFGLYKKSFWKSKRKVRIENSFDMKSLTQIIDGIPEELVLISKDKELKIIYQG